MMTNFKPRIVYMYVSHSQSGLAFIHGVRFSAYWEKVAEHLCNQDVLIYCTEMFRANSTDHAKWVQIWWYCCCTQDIYIFFHFNKENGERVWRWEKFAFNWSVINIVKFSILTQTMIYFFILFKFNSQYQSICSALLTAGMFF